jgi:hypothetical protein
VTLKQLPGSSPGSRRCSLAYSWNALLRRLNISSDIHRWPASFRNYGITSTEKVIFQNYRIVYRIIDNNIVIVGVIHAAMDLSRQGKNRGWDVT